MSRQTARQGHHPPAVGFQTSPAERLLYPIDQYPRCSGPSRSLLEDSVVEIGQKHK
jgi:hypothetical protein